MAPTIKLTYWHIPGRAEVARLLLTLGQIEFIVSKGLGVADSSAGSACVADSIATAALDPFYRTIASSLISGRH